MTFSELCKNLLKNTKIYSKFKRPYYYVPECPVCGSFKTGRLIQARGDYTNGWIERESLKNGEIVHVMEQLPVDANAFCLDCGNIWDADIKTFFLNSEELEYEKKVRDTPTLYSISMEKFNESENTKKKKRGKIANTVCGFIGHI